MQSDKLHDTELEKKPESQIEEYDYLDENKENIAPQDNNRDVSKTDDVIKAPLSQQHHVLTQEIAPESEIGSTAAIKTATDTDTTVEVINAGISTEIDRVVRIVNKYKVEKRW